MIGNGQQEAQENVMEVKAMMQLHLHRFLHRKSGIAACLQRR